VIQDPARPALGAYLVTLDGPKELTLTASDPSLGRIDLVVGEIVQADPGFSVHVVQGQPAATPQAPAAPSPLSLPLAQIQVPAAGATPTVTDLRQFTAGLGAVLPVRGPADRPAVAPISQLVYRLDTHVIEVQTSPGSWVPYRPPRGSVDIWHPLSFTVPGGRPPFPPASSGWTDFGGGYATAAYTMTEDGWVRLRGLVKRSDGNDQNAGGAIGTLPVGYRPLAIHIFAQWSYTKAARIDVRPDGYVGNQSEGVPSAAYVSLDGIAFPTY
jgi:hypothetical protein